MSTYLYLECKCPPGWVTGTPGVSRNDQLSIIGRGVVTLCAQTALTYLLATTTTTMKETQ